MDTSANGGSRWEISRITAVIRRSERRRLTFVVGVSLLYLGWLLWTVRSNLGLLPFGLAVVLVVYLYTRSSARATVVGSAVGPGILWLGLYGYQVARTVAGGSTEPVMTTLLSSSDWLLFGLVLVGIGAWLQRREL